MTEQHEQPASDDAAAPEQPVAGTRDATGDAGKGREWLSQLQSMIDDLATQAAPTVRQIGVKAAELAAIAGDKAGPIAQRAAEITGDAGQKLAERSRHLAEELRRDLPGEGEAGSGTEATGEGVVAPEVEVEPEPDSRPEA